MTTFESDVVVVGAGVVGLAVARAFAVQGRDVVVLEREGAIGQGTSSRNSEVIHSGIYYPPGSLKARACVEGREKLYAYCQSRGIPHRRCGKLIVLAPGQNPAALETLAATARANGVDDLVFLNAAEVRRLEPALSTDGALLSPSTGILDSHAFMLALQGDLEDAGGVVALNAPVLGGDVGNGIGIATGGTDPTTMRARLVVNCAGLGAVALPTLFNGFPAPNLRRAFFAKGNYFSLAGKTPFSRLVYPLPEAAGLGVHATIDMAGSVRFGPDVEWVDDPEALAVDPRRAARFYAAIRRYWPGLPDGALQPGYAGIRPKLGGEGTAAADFVIEGESTHGVPGLINLLGIESPGLTSCLALADEVVALAGR
jgi:L-2-hydroxyglutarate oxidase LhgO